jgi:FKBP-type peptidyl-prolyl cis-trans isomerase FklB
MKKLYGLLCALTLATFVPMCAADDAAPATEKVAPAVSAPVPAAEKPAAAAPKSDKEKMSYAIGASWGMSLKTVDVEVDLETLFQGIRDASTGQKLALPEDEIRATLRKMMTDVTQKQQAHMKELAEKNAAEGSKFLEANKKKEGVVTLPSGLQYKVIKEGEGKLPGPSDIVTVKYRGTFIDGKEFDSSDKAGRPLDVPLDGGFIPGMTDALKMMKVGSKWTIYIPPELAYREQGMAPVIGPNAVLIFDVEALASKEKPKEAGEPPAK